MNLRYYRSAVAEATRAAQYYELSQQNLGKRFVDELRVGFEQIRQFPLSGTEIYEGIRRHLIRTFPFGIIYRNTSDTIFVLAVADLRRRPGYWLNRVV